MDSIIQTKKECFVCHTTLGLHRHHVMFGVANRKKAEQDGCWCYLCGYHHNLSNHGVHFDKKLDLKLKQITQKRWCEYYGKSTDDFIGRFGRSYYEKEN